MRGEEGRASGAWHVAWELALLQLACCGCFPPNQLVHCGRFPLPQLVHCGCLPSPHARLPATLPPSPQVLDERGLQRHPPFINKVIQLYETYLVGGLRGWVAG